jgi:hypothetical protein
MDPSDRAPYDKRCAACGSHNVKPVDPWPTADQVEWRACCDCGADGPVDHRQMQHPWRWDKRGYLEKSDLLAALKLLRTWHSHIDDVYGYRGCSDAYVPDEAMRTCHGCGAPDRIMFRGLCHTCMDALNGLGITEPSR